MTEAQKRNTEFFPLPDDAIIRDLIVPEHGSFESICTANGRRPYYKGGKGEILEKIPTYFTPGTHVQIVYTPPILLPDENSWRRELRNSNLMYQRYGLKPCPGTHAVDIAAHPEWANQNSSYTKIINGEYEYLWFFFVNDGGEYPICSSMIDEDDGPAGCQWRAGVRLLPV